MLGFHWGVDRKRLWYQEKSVFCTEGRHSLYIAKKILVLMICMLSLVPGKVSLAGESHRALHQNINVVIRDSKLRKVLVKKGCTYETSSSILLEIPWEEIEGKKCQLMVECQDESEEKKRFYIECIYAK